MTQEERNLLIKDLCGRLPYGVIVKKEYSFDFTNGTISKSKKIERLDLEDIDYLISGDNCIDVLKPYLRPMSSMTEEEREDFWKNVLDIDWRELEFDEEPNEVPFPFTENDCGFYLDFNYLADLFAVFDWLNAHHFDYRGLIQKGLAISTEEFNPYKD